MIRAAICDDNVKDLNHTCKLIDKYNENTSNKIIYDCFTNGMDLLSRITTGVFYNIIFLETVMPVINGIETASEIYKTSKATQIVFITSSRNFAVESYSVDALDYILKPISEKNLIHTITKFLQRYKDTESCEIIIKQKSGITLISSQDICYIEVIDHYLFYHMADKEVIKCRQKFYEIEQTFKNNEKFIKTHRSYVVNVDYIKKITPEGIYMKTGEIVPVSKTNYEALTNVFLNASLQKIKYNI